MKRFVIRDLARALAGDSEIEACDDDAAALKVENTALPLTQIDPEAIKQSYPLWYNRYYMYLILSLL
jgi:hypothetical protein